MSGSVDEGASAAVPQQVRPRQEHPHQDPGPSTASMAIASVASATLAVLMVVATLFWFDRAWPFAPFRMFAYSPAMSSTVRKAAFVGFTAGGRELRLDALDFHLRRAEVEGQLDPESHRLDAGRMASLAKTYNDSHRGADRLVRLEFHLVGRRLVDGVPGERTDVVMDVWEHR